MSGDAKITQQGDRLVWSGKYDGAIQPPAAAGNPDLFEAMSHRQMHDGVKNGKIATSSQYEAATGLGREAFYLMMATDTFTKKINAAFATGWRGHGAKAAEAGLRKSAENTTKLTDSMIKLSTDIAGLADRLSWVEQNMPPVPANARNSKLPQGPATTKDEAAAIAAESRALTVMLGFRDGINTADTTAPVIPEPKPVVSDGPLTVQQPGAGPGGPTDLSRQPGNQAQVNPANTLTGSGPQTGEPQVAQNVAGAQPNSGPSGLPVQQAQSGSTAGAGNIQQASVVPAAPRVPPPPHVPGTTPPPGWTQHQNPLGIPTWVAPETAAARSVAANQGGRPVPGMGAPGAVRPRKKDDGPEAEKFSAEYLKSQRNGRDLLGVDSPGFPKAVPPVLEPKRDNDRKP